MSVTRTVGVCVGLDTNTALANVLADVAGAVVITIVCGPVVVIAETRPVTCRLEKDPSAKVVVPACNASTPATVTALEGVELVEDPMVALAANPSPLMENVELVAPEMEYPDAKVTVIAGFSVNNVSAVMPFRMLHST